MNDPSPPATASILLVDDDPEVRAMVAMSLGQAGLRVLEAGSGRLALDIIESESVGVIVCDVGMPEMSGIDVVCMAARRESPTWPPDPPGHVQAASRAVRPADGRLAIVRG